MAEVPEALKLRGSALGPLATNAYAVEAPGGWVLIDAPEGVAVWLEQEGISPNLLLLTHQHFDHVLGAGSVVEKFGCPVWAFSEQSSELTLEDMFKGLEGTSFEIAPYPTSRLIEPTGAGAALDVLGLSVDVLHVPGHSPDSLAFHLRDPGVVFGGDVLFAGGIGRTDFPGGDSELLLAGVREKIFPLGERVKVMPGHETTTTVGEERATNPYFL